MTRSRALWTSAAAFALLAIVRYVVVPSLFAPDSGGDHLSPDAAAPAPSDDASRHGTLAARSGRSATRAGAARLRLRLTGPGGGAPPADVRVVLVGPDADGRPTSIEAVPDSSGVVEFAGVPPGDAYSLRIEMPHEVTERRSGIRLTANETTDLGVVAMAKGAVLEGRVVDESGKAIIGADVRVQVDYYRSFTPEEEAELTAALDREPSAIAKVATDGEGRFRFDTLSPGRYDVRAWAPEFAVAAREIELPRAGGRQEPLDVVLFAGSIVAGVVVDQAGNAMPGARISFLYGYDDFLTRAWALWARGTVVTDVSGRFRAHVASYLESSVVVVASGMPPMWFPKVRPGEEDLRLVLGTDAGVRVTVLDDATSSPIEGVVVGVGVTSAPDSSAAFELAVPKGRSDSHGACDLMAGSGRISWLQAQHPAYQPGGYRRETRAGADPLRGLVGDVDRALEPGERRSLTVRLRRGLRVVGRVLDSQGTPISGAVVRYTSSALGVQVSTSRTGVDGEYRIDGYLVAGLNFFEKVDVKASGLVWRGAAFSPEIPKDAVGEVNRDIVLVPESVVRGRVLDSEGRGVAGAEVDVLGATGSSARTAEDGSYEVTGVDPRPAASIESDPVRHTQASIRASAPEYVSGTSLPFELIAGSFTTAPDVILRHGAKLHVHVIDRQGAPAAGAVIALSSTSGGTGQSGAKTDADGIIEFADLEDGEFEVIARASRGLSKPANVRVDSATSAATVEVVLDPTHDISGHVVDAEGKPVPLARVVAHTPDAYRSVAFWRLPGDPEAVTDAHGAFLLNGLPGTRVRLLVFRPEWVSPPVHVDPAGAPPVLVMRPMSASELMRLAEIEVEIRSLNAESGHADRTKEEDALRTRVHALYEERTRIVQGGGD